ncbi:hypothetical protein K457DRAFT_656951 [Linnemannia elongata AG-77]|uniref:Uncharacterized protein n=1 Tax=Linnemannia elongata AG-77 TaxID=1314771 RepID=A0A197KDP9_9FUNG|nr:hypothetical protein K457DRAFT_656951 [Linnemannia elongata AG-77]
MQSRVATIQWSAGLIFFLFFENLCPGLSFFIMFFFSVVLFLFLFLFANIVIYPGIRANTCRKHSTIST